MVLTVHNKDGPRKEDDSENDRAEMDLLENKQKQSEEQVYSRWRIDKKHKGKYKKLGIIPVERCLKIL